MYQNQLLITILSLITGVLIIGIIFILWQQLTRKPFRQRLHSIENLIKQANLDFAELTNFEKYFANRDEIKFLAAYEKVKKAIPGHFDKLGLPVPFVNEIRTFLSNYNNSSNLRSLYNDNYIPKEAAKYADFFKNLETYPLSADQITGIIRDEDNNLIIAGAGTGKTTTVAGKVAYLLEKGIALPEELLVISFTKNAVREMYDRCMRFCKHIPAAEKLDVRTFNSYGFLVSRHCSAKEILLAFNGDDDAARAFLQAQFDELFMNDSDFQRKALNFLAFFSRPPRNEFEFETQNDYLTHEKSFKNITLDGTKVKSKEEMEIGNFFCLFGIKYEYQRHFPLKPEDRNADYGAYQPDFYLPDHNIWHEHFGITRDGEVPDWFDRRPPHESAKDSYHAGIVWKEQIHAKYKTRFIKTYSYENQEGNLLNNLKTRLIAEGVQFQKRSSEEMLQLIKKSDHYEDFMKLIYTFLGLMKSNGKQPNNLRTWNDKRLKVFLDVFKPLYRAYEIYLSDRSSVDYNDMINLATHHFLEGQFTKPYKYILVDEFQDMSLGRYKLIQSIRHQNPDVKLYAVGDDWQSIFRFTGSDISIITQFEKHFGYTSRTEILKTYRFNEQILTQSSNFIQRNPAQIRKQLTAQSTTPEGHQSFAYLKMPPVLGGREQYHTAKANVIISILKEISRANAQTNIFLIGRYKFNVIRNLKNIQEMFPEMTISYFTAHKVKGMTCDYAILLDVDSGTLGFPSEIADDPLLLHLLHEGDKFENAEERRVFYVAITRARHKNYLVYNEKNPSKFLLELLDPTGQMVTNIIKRCPKCKGPMSRRMGPYSEFYGCSHYPDCDGTVQIKSKT